MVGLPSSDVPNKLYVYDIGSAGQLSGEKIVSVGNTGEGGFVLQSQCSNLIYIAETADQTVRVLNSDLTLNRVLTSANGIGEGPIGLLENVLLRRLYVSNKLSNTLSVFAACQPSATPTPR